MTGTQQFQLADPQFQMLISLQTVSGSSAGFQVALSDIRSWGCYHIYISFKVKHRLLT